MARAQLRAKSSYSLRAERSLYERATGYNYEAVKIFMPANRAKPVYAPYIEHVPPDVTACIFWLKNRDPQHWRDSQQLEVGVACLGASGRLACIGSVTHY
jgi:hypothetical protein